MYLCHRVSSLSPRRSLRLQHILLLQVWDWTLGLGQETEARLAPGASGLLCFSLPWQRWLMLPWPKPRACLALRRQCPNTSNSCNTRASSTTSLPSRMTEPQRPNADHGYWGQLSWRLGTFLSYLGPPDTGQSVSLDSKGARPVPLGGSHGLQPGHAGCLSLLAGFGKEIYFCFDGPTGSSVSIKGPESSPCNSLCICANNLNLVRARKPGKSLNKWRPPGSTCLLRTVVGVQDKPASSQESAELERTLLLPWAVSRASEGRY